MPNFKVQFVERICKTHLEFLLAGDCFELGRQSYNNGDYYHTSLWMNEARDRLAHETNKTTTRQDILEYLAFSTYMEGDSFPLLFYVKTH